MSKILTETKAAQNIERFKQFWVDGEYDNKIMLDSIDIAIEVLKGNPPDAIDKQQTIKCINEFIKAWSGWKFDVSEMLDSLEMAIEAIEGLEVT